MYRKRKGFTLIELLVVIAIIALLMSILMPALRNVRDQAKNSMCFSKLQQWGVMFNMYASEWDGKLMGWNEYAWYTYGPDPEDKFVEHAWVPMMYEYAKDFDMYLCPAAKQLWSWGIEPDNPLSAWDFQYMNDQYAIGEWYPYYMVGRSENPEFSYGSYGKNEWVTDGLDYMGGHYFRTIRVRGVARIPLHGDCYWAAGFPLWDDNPSSQYFHSFMTFEDGGEINRWNIDRHNLSVNFVFLDWSVRKVGLRQLWALKWNPETVGGVSPWGNKNYVPDWEDLDDPAWPEWMKTSKSYDL
jgi:prepilin-type N-terminal cleavage/methylation domain-containing protein/prepilin-type processing-associated H-X9-DG protein